MKLTFVLVAAAAVFTTGCTEFVSLNPFVPEQEAVMDPALLGVWTSDDATFIVKQNDKAYSIAYMEKGPTAMKFEGHLIKVGDAKLLDVLSITEDPFVLPAHLLVRVWTGGHTLRWAFLDTGWLKDQAGRQGAVQTIDKRTVVTAAGPAAREALLKLAADDKAYDNTNTLTRVQ